MSARPITLHYEHLTGPQRRAVVAWLRANGCRHHVPIDSPITVKNGWITVTTFLIRTDRPSGGYLPDVAVAGMSLRTKTRRYRQRVPLVLRPPQRTLSPIPSDLTGSELVGNGFRDMGAALRHALVPQIDGLRRLGEAIRNGQKATRHDYTLAE